MVVPPVQSRLERQSDGAKGLPGIFAPKRAGVKSRTGDGSTVLNLYIQKYNYTIENILLIWYTFPKASFLFFCAFKRV